MTKDTQNGTIWSDRKRTIFGLPWTFTTYILTDKKFITRKGLLTIREDEIDLYRIIDKSLRQTLDQRIFGCGTVTLNCRDVDTPIKEVSVKNPREFMELLDEAVNKQRDKYKTRGRDMIGHDVDCNYN